MMLAPSLSAKVRVSVREIPPLFLLRVLPRCSSQVCLPNALYVLLSFLHLAFFLRRREIHLRVARNQGFLARLIHNTMIPLPRYALQFTRSGSRLPGTTGEKDF